MTKRMGSGLVLVGLWVVGAVVFFTGANWGLPSRAVDPYLFGSADRAWTGAEIVARGGAWKPDPKRAADQDPNPVTRRDQLVWVNETDQQKAEILRRYRLFSYQPDEMVTFMALSGMRGGSFDPRIYQYGGLWIYPIGAMLKFASLKWVGLVTLTPDMTHYLDHPEDFGRFYVVARVYSGLWGLAGIWAVYRLTMRFTRKRTAAAAAGACFLLMPIVVNGVHEAKPHLAGAVLILLAALAATKYVESGGRRWWAITGIVCGMAVGMVLSGVIALVIIPLMVMLRERSWGDRVRIALGAGALAVVAYCVTNPYVPINLVRDRAIVLENLGALSKAKAIFGESSDVRAWTNARRLIVDGASIVGGVFGLTGLLIAAANLRWWASHGRGRVVAILLGVPAGIVLIQFVALAGGKAAEFGRFAILPDVALVMVGVVLAFSLRVARWWAGPIFATLVLLAGLQGLAYLMAFVADTKPEETSRTVAAKRLAEFWDRGARTLAVPADPAPYCLPPADVTRWKLLLLPADGKVPEGGPWPDVIVSPVDDVRRGGAVSGTPYVRTTVDSNRGWRRTRISWADKPFEILAKRELVEPSKP